MPICRFWGAGLSEDHLETDVGVTGLYGTGWSLWEPDRGPF
jgi:hypothetical protein